MIVPDVNVLVSAHRRDADHSSVLSAWLENAVAAPEPLGVTDATLGGLVRIVTHAKIFRSPTPIETALTHVDQLLAARGVVRIWPGARHWDIVRGLCRDSGAAGALFADAHHAAVAIEHGATWATLDRDFSRFPGLRVVDPRG